MPALQAQKRTTHTSTSQLALPSDTKSVEVLGDSGREEVEEGEDEMQRIQRGIRSLKPTIPSKAHSFLPSRLLITNSFNPLQIALLTQISLCLPVPSTKFSCNGSSIHQPMTRRSHYPLSQGIKP